MHLPNFEFQQWYQSNGFHIVEIVIHVLKKILKFDFFFLYVRCIDESLNLKFNFGFNFRVYN